MRTKLAFFKLSHFLRLIGIMLGIGDDIVTVITGSVGSIQKPVDLKFPKQVIQGSLGELAEVLSEGSELSPELAFGAALTCLSSMISGELTLCIPDFDTRLYTVLLGSSDIAKKSSTMKRVVQFFETIPSAYSLQVCHGVGSAEGLMRVIQENEKVLLCYDELESFFRKAGIEGSVLLQAFATLFESHKYESYTKHQAIVLENARLAFLACCTLATFEHCWTQEALSIGLDNRLFLVNADAKPPVAWPSHPSENRLEQLRKTLQMQLAQLPMKITASDKARRRFQDWYNTRYSKDSPFTKRLSTIAWKLMALLAFTQNRKEVDLEVVEQAIAICDHQALLREFACPSDVRNEHARMETNITRKLKEKGPLTQAELIKFTNAGKSGFYFFQQALRNLQECGVIGRTTNKWHLIA
jgi:hypothetical protein